MATRTRPRQPVLRLAPMPGAVRAAGAHLRANAAIWTLWAASAIWIAWFATRIHVYFVMPDELRYVKQSVSWADARPVVPGSEAWTTFSQLQPLILAPLWGLLSTITAYKASHVVTSLLFAGAVFPAYLLARRVLGSHTWALAAAALCIVIPWTVLAGTMMLESTAYPAALWALYAVQHAAVRQSRRADLIAAVALLLAYFARTQLLVLWATLPVAIIANGLRFPTISAASTTRRVREIVALHWPLFAVGLAVAVVGAIDDKILVGDAPGGAPLNMDSVAFGREALAYVAVGVGMLPLALSFAWVMATVWRPRTPDGHAFAVIGVTATVLLAVIISGGTRLAAGPTILLAVVDRYLVYVAPLLFIGMFAFLLDRRPLTLVTLVGGGLAAWVAWASVLKLAGPTFVSPTATYHPVLNDWAKSVGADFGITNFTSGKLAGSATVILVVAVALARRWVRTEIVAGVVVLAVGLFCLNETAYTRDKLKHIQPAAGYSKGRNWADQVLPRGAHATVLLSNLGVDGLTADATWWDVEFWNRKVNSIRYAIDDAVRWDGQAVSRRMGLDEATGRTSGMAGHHYLVRGVADRRFGFMGETTVGAPNNNLQLWQIANPGQLNWWFHDLDETGYIPAGRQGLLRIFATEGGGRRTVTIPVGTPFGAKHPAPYSVLLDGRPLTSGTVAVGAKNDSATVHVDVPAGGNVELALRAEARAGSTGLQFYGANVAR